MVQYWVVTGGNRGIGLAIVNELALRKNVVVFTTVRDKSNIGQLEKIVSQHDNVKIVQLRLEVVEDAKKAAAEVSKVTDHVDVVLANAGIAYNWEPIEKVDPEVVREHFTVNTLGTFALFQAFLPLMRKSGQSKFVSITTDAACMTVDVPYPVSAVGISKVGINYIMRRVHTEHHSSDGIIAFPINPGGVKTDIGAFAAPTAFGMKEFTIEPEDSAKMILSVIDNATAKQSGKFFRYDGKELPW